MHVRFNRDLPSPLVHGGVIINAKEDLYEINFCQIMLWHVKRYYSILSICI